MVIVAFMAIGVAISLIFAAFPTFTVSGTGFFLAIEADQYEEAYGMFDSPFQAKVNINQFKEMIQQTGLDKYKSVEWVKTLEDKNAGYAAILGVVTTYDNKKIPIQIRFVKITDSTGQDAWRISSLRTNEAANEGIY